jgi:hypothetical protein
MIMSRTLNSTRVSLMMRLPCWQGSFAPYTSFVRRGGDHPRAASSTATPSTSSPTVPRGRNLTPPTSTSTPTEMTIATKATTRRRNTSEIRRRIISSRRSCPRVCVALSDFNFSSKYSSSSEEDENVKCKQGDFTSMCLMGKSSRNAFDSDSDVSDDISFESLSLRVNELENAICNQDKLLCRVFCENKNLNLELENSFAEIASFRSVHDDMSAKPCDNCKMIIVNYADQWLVHTQVASQLKGAKLELKELKACSLLLGACTSCPMLRSDSDACVVEIKDPKRQIDHSSHCSVLFPPCEMCVSLKGRLFHATKENTELK